MPDNSPEIARHPRTRRRRLMHATAVLGPNQSITVTGELVDFDFFTHSLEELVKKAKKAKGEGISLKTFLLIQEDIAKASSC